jgi:signal peptidase
MKKGTVAAVAVIAVIAASLIGLRFWVYDASGVDPPFTVVVSQSMQHSDDSEVGIIDTGDMVLLRSTDKHDPVTYVEGYASGYEKFGEYGDVIVYEREGQNQVIHRAILYLEYNGDGTFTGVGLEDYVDENGDPLWSCTSGNDPNNLSGTLTLNDIGAFGKTVTVNLTEFAADGSSGYLTMGDNEGNYTVDQLLGIADGLVTDDLVKGTAWVEIPWVGAVKLILNGDDANLRSYAPSSIWYLAASIVSFVLVIVAVGYLIDVLNGRRTFRGGH